MKEEDLYKKIFFDEESLLYKLEEICEEQKNKKLGKKEKFKIK